MFIIDLPPDTGPTYAYTTCCECEQLRQRIAELEAENERLQQNLRDIDEENTKLANRGVKKIKKAAIEAIENIGSGYYSHTCDTCRKAALREVDGEA